MSVCVETLPARCEICGGPYRGHYDEPRYACPVCRWHVYLRPTPTLLPDPLPRLEACLLCGQPIRQPADRGRPRRFCSQAHADKHRYLRMRGRA